MDDVDLPAEEGHHTQAIPRESARSDFFLNVR
jgi:hypothetical protein